MRVPGLRFGDPRVIVLLAALCLHLHLPHGFSNALLGTRVAALRGNTATEYTRTQILRPPPGSPQGLIHRLPGTYRYAVTTAGRRIALLFQKTFARVLRRGLARLDAAIH